jgi:hypothetical protein
VQQLAVSRCALVLMTGRSPTPDRSASRGSAYDSIFQRFLSRAGLHPSSSAAQTNCPLDLTNGRSSLPNRGDHGERKAPRSDCGRPTFDAKALIYIAMSLPPSEEKRHYASILRHTVHAVRTRGQTVEFCRESALSAKTAVQKLVQDWSEGLPISAIVALDPQPVWWHLGNVSEASALQTDVEVRRFAGRLPHGLRGPLELIGCNAADGTGVSSGREERWLLGVAAGDALAAAAAEASERGIVTAAPGSATLGGVAAAATALP